MEPIPDNLPAQYRIGDLIVDTGTRRVYRGKEVLQLAGLTYDLLLALAEAAPAMLPYDALAERIWNGRPVTPETIAQRAKMLRDALSDDARSPRYLELIRGNGYRLIPDVTPVTAQAGADGPHRRWPWAVAAAIIAVAAAIFVTSKTSQTPSVAVLPFMDMSPLGDQQYLADGVAEEVINHLAGLEGLDVASRTESFFYRDELRDLKHIGNELNVATILEGSVRKSADEIRVTVQLIDVDSGYHLWSENFDQKLEDIFQIQDAIAASVAGTLGVKLGAGSVNQFLGAGTRNIAAYEAFLQGDYAEAIRLDPDYAAAWAGAGLRIATTMWDHMPSEAPGILERAYQHTSTALRLDPQSAQAHRDFATINYATMAWNRSEEAFARALSLGRDEHVLNHYANMMMRSGRSRRAQQLHEERESMLRVQRTPSHLRIRVYIALGDYDTAREMVSRMTSERRHFMALTIALNEGSVDDVRAAIDALPTNTVAYRQLFGPIRDLVTTPDRALEFLAELLEDGRREWPSKFRDVALLAAYLGNPEFALDAYLRDLRFTAIRFGGLWYPLMSEVRRLPEFKTFAIEANLVDYWRQYGWSDWCRPVGEEDFSCN